MQLPEETSNRNYKDSVFVDLFAWDVSAKDNFISLYNALHNTNLDPLTTDVKPMMLEKVLYMKYYNDIAMLVDGKIIVMIEHQSTINQNMPLRFLEYIARIYEKITNPKEKFERKLVKLPMPEFYVFYNGKENFPPESEMKLSDAFLQMSKNKDFPLEISVKVININIDSHNPILSRCNVLNEYSTFIEQVRHNIENNVLEPLTTAIRQSIGKGILLDYLNRKATEVENMLLTEYDYDTDIAIQRQEAYNEGIQLGRTEGIQLGLSRGISQGSQQAKIETAKALLSMSLSIHDIEKATGLPEETIVKLAKDKP